MPGHAQKGLGAVSQARSAPLNQASGAVAWRREESQITLVPRSWGPLTSREMVDAWPALEDVRDKLRFAGSEWASRISAPKSLVCSAKQIELRQ